MRIFKPEEFVNKKYSIQQNKLVELENRGEYFSKEIAKLVLLNIKHNDKKNLEKLQKQDIKELEKTTKAFLAEKSKKVQKTDILDLVNKNYEIIKLDIVPQKYYLLEKSDINSGDDTNAETFFLLENAKEALKLYKQINENIINSSSSLEAIYKSDIKNNQKKLKLLKEKDKNDYLNSLKLYNTLKETDILTKYNKLVIDNTKLAEKNEKLNSTITKLKKQKADLEIKLKIALDEFEKTKKNKEKHINIVSKLLKKRK